MFSLCRKALPESAAASFACNKVCQAKAKLVKVSAECQMTAGETLSAVGGGVRARRTTLPDQISVFQEE